MKLHTVFITYNRLELTKQAIESYLDTVSVPYSFAIVDNASTDGTVEWLMPRYGGWLITSEVNHYPGKACNAGWMLAPEDADFLHRADNDFIFLPGWCQQVENSFRKKRVGQVGLRTDTEELHAVYNVGGNCVIRRELWDKGLRYDETPWPEFPPGYTEDSGFSPAVENMGYLWTRVKKPCIRSISVEDPEDVYYQRTWADRRIRQYSSPS